MALWRAGRCSPFLRPASSRPLPLFDDLQFSFYYTSSLILYKFIVLLVFFVVCGIAVGRLRSPNICTLDNNATSSVSSIAVLLLIVMAFSILMK